MEVNVKSRFSLAATPTSTGFLADAVDLIQAGTPNSENELDPLGAILALGTIRQDSTQTYQVQVINDVDNSGTNTPATVADTGTIAVNDTRINNPFMFLAIDWNLVKLEFLMVKITMGGGGTTSFAIGGAWLGKKSDVPAQVLVAANYSI